MSNTPSPAVVVGIDGSQRSVNAALWAVDEAVSRDVPLRLLYVIESPAQSGADTGQSARNLACADVSIRRTLVAVEAAKKPVKIEWEILEGDPVRCLLEASRSADLLCIGSMGIAHATGHRLGSAATALLTSALCPVAIVRGDQHWSAQPRHIVVELDESPDHIDVLEAGIDQARLRGAPLTVLAPWQAKLADVRDDADGAKARARLSKRLAHHLSANPDIEFNPVAVGGSPLNYLDRQSHSIQLFITSRERRSGLGEIVGSARTAPHQLSCSVLVCRHHHRL